MAVATPQPWSPSDPSSPEPPSRGLPSSPEPPQNGSLRITGRRRAQTKEPAAALAGEGFNVPHSARSSREWGTVVGQRRAPFPEGCEGCARGGGEPGGPPLPAGISRAPGAPRGRDVGGIPISGVPHAREGRQTPKDTEEETSEGSKGLRGDRGIRSPAVLGHGFVGAPGGPGTGLWQLLGHRTRQSPVLELERRDTGDVEGTGLL